ncbi:MAG TPA: hemolysin family protein [Spirochaetota bacterium]|nr:hemolysin family protein [Spirochaetota bacterium]
MINIYIGTQIIILIFILLSAFFSATETALVSANVLYIQNLVNKGNKKAEDVLSLIENPDKALTMLLIGNNIANIGATAFITFFASRALLIHDSKLFIVTIAQTIFFLIFCELFPKIYSRSKAERLLFLNYWLIKIFNIFFMPLISLIIFITDFVKKIININDTQLLPISSRDEIDSLFRAVEKEGIIDSQHYIYFNEILSFKDVRANEVMTPLIDIISIGKNQPIKLCITLIEKTRFSRIPVFEERVDNIVGYIYYQDILRNPLIKNLQQIMHPPHFVPSTKKIYDLIKEMEANNVAMVFVVNEYGAVEGLLTDEDIAEEIVGEIQTRDHPQDESIKEIAPWKYSIAGNLDIEFFQRRFGIKIEKHDFETVAGFLLYQMGYIPKPGEKIRYMDITFQIERATDRAIERVIVTIPKRKTTIAQA